MQSNQENITKLFKKPGEKRYDYFIKKVVENEEVYGLADEEGWITAEFERAVQAVCDR
jgi:hypothetical protein